MGREQEWLWCNPTWAGNRNGSGVTPHRKGADIALVYPTRTGSRNGFGIQLIPELVSVRPGVIGYFMKIYGAQSSVDGRLRVHTWWIPPWWWGLCWVLKWFRESRGENSTYQRQSRQFFMSHRLTGDNLLTNSYKRINDHGEESLKGI